jgi:thiamine pyrophosphate-dependent acetolactate synthase large subunit-like protein
MQRCIASLRGAGAGRRDPSQRAKRPRDLERRHCATAAEFLQGKQKPIPLIGSKLRAASAEKQAMELAEALGCAVTVMVAAKSFFALV